MFDTATGTFLKDGLQDFNSPDSEASKISRFFRFLVEKVVKSKKISEVRNHFFSLKHAAVFVRMVQSIFWKTTSCIRLKQELLHVTYMYHASI